MRKAKWMDCKLALSFAGSSSTAPVLLNRATKHAQHGSSPNLAIRHALLRHGDGAKQSFRIQRNLAPDARQFLSGTKQLALSDPLSTAPRTLTRSSGWLAPVRARHESLEQSSWATGATGSRFRAGRTLYMWDLLHTMNSGLT